MAARFHYKTRTFEAAARNPYRPRGQVRYDRWITVASYDTFEEARAHQHRNITGLKDRAVFHKGSRITDGGCRQIRTYDGDPVDHNRFRRHI